MIVALRLVSHIRPYKFTPISESWPLPLICPHLTDFCVTIIKLVWWVGRRIQIQNTVRLFLSNGSWNWEQNCKWLSKYCWLLLLFSFLTSDSKLVLVLRNYSIYTKPITLSKWLTRCWTMVDWRVVGAENNLPFTDSVFISMKGKVTGPRIKIIFWRCQQSVEWRHSFSPWRIQKSLIV